MKAQLQFEMVNGVQTIGVGRLMEAFYGKDWWKVNYQETTEAIRKWIKENNAHYYADVKENFSIYVGTLEAKKAGKKILVMENLS